MNELELSTNLNEIELEIKWHKENAGRSVWEIGRRLKHVKENDLVHGEFVDWVENQGIQYREANRMMKVADELSPNMTTLSHLGTSALYLIATLPEEEREKEHALEGGETKTVDEMTVRELEEIKRRLKEKESQLEQAKKSEQIAIEQLEREQSKQPQVIEKEIEIERVPDDYDFYKSNYNATKENYEYYKSQNEELRKEMKLLEERISNAGTSEEIVRLRLKLKETSKKLERKEEEYHRLDNFRADAEEIIHKYAPIKYFRDFDEVLKDRKAFGDLKETIYMLERWIKEMKRDLPSQIIIEGEN